jgi:hypothetical protein
MYQPFINAPTASESYLADVMVILKPEYAEKIELILPKLLQSGLKIVRTDRDEGFVEGVVDASKIKQLSNIEGVSYVRDVFNYMARNEPPR